MQPEPLQIRAQDCFTGGQEKEWLVTNGLGGYAFGTLTGDLTRRYHGLFMPNLANPKGRHLMISRYSEWICIGDVEVRLDEVNAIRGVREGESPCGLQMFILDGNIARWRYRIGEALIERSIFMPHTQNTVCVRYQLMEGGGARLRMRPYLAFRRQDAPLQERGYGRFAVTLVENRLDCSLPASELLLRMTVNSRPAVFVAEPDEIEQELTREQKRGHAYRESAYSPGYFTIELGREPLAFIASTHKPERLVFDVEGAYMAELQRVAALREPAFENDRVATLLSQAADQFRVLPASRIEDAIVANAAGQEFRTVIAGYPWFGDWGRDTMISLEGLMLSTGRVREARATLQTFAGYVADGLLPNLFPEGERDGLYHTVDATLWYFHAIHRYLQATGDRALLTHLLPTLEGIIERHVGGTRFGIRVDTDGLLSAGEEGYQLTWMDAKVDGWVVTPRRGKPVEIQALWYNALQLMRTWVGAEHTKGTMWGELADRARAAFNKRFWNADRKCLLDVIDGPMGDDASVRPNQIFGMSLDYPILDEARWRDVIAVVTDELLTPYGLRTLSRDHKDYRATYHGDLRFRDAAYHQGTVWPWLLGHYVDAALKVKRSKSDLRALLDGFEDHLSVAGIGSISEVFDAEPPHLPHGCIAQAWSVAELLRGWLATRT